MRIAAATVLLLLLAACGDGHDTLAPQAGGGAGSPASAVAAGQRDGILQLIEAQRSAWAAKDAVAYGRTYTEDAEMINPVGGILSGRAIITSQHAFLFNPATGPFRASTSNMAVRGIDMLTGSIGFVKLDVTLTGFSTLPPGLPAVEPGVVRTRVTWIVVKSGAEWLIMHQQMTPLPPMP